MKRTVAVAAAVAAMAGGTAGAIAATSPEEREQAVLDDAANRLGVSSEELRSALGAAQDAELDAAVARGDLTQEQADEIKERRDEAGTVLGFGPGRGGPGGPHHGFHGGPHLMDEVAEAIGITPERLFRQLRNGRSLAAIAKANGTTLAEVKEKAEAGARAELQEELDAGRLTQEQHDELLERLPDVVDDLGERGGPFGGGRGGPGAGFGGPPPGGDWS